MRQLLTALFSLVVAYGSAVPVWAEPEAHTQKPDAIDMAVCHEVLALANVAPAPEGGDPVHLLDATVLTAKIDIDNDGQLEHLWISDDGTAHFFRPHIESATGQDLQLNSDAIELDGDLRWAHGSRWLIRGDRAYIVRMADEKGYPMSLDRMTAQHVEAPVCRYKSVGVPSVIPVQDEDAPLCKAVEAGKIDYLKSSEFRRSIPTRRPILAGLTEIIARIEVDADNDGHPERLLLYSAESSAGSGCRDAYYDTGPRRRGRLHTALDKMQDVSLAGETYPKAGCEDADPRWFRFRGKSYLDSRSSSAMATESTYSEYLKITTLAMTQSREVCRATYFPTTRLVGVWRGDGWTPVTPEE